VQKTNKKASILIWAFFLSLIIAISFISISSKINKNIKNNISLESELKTNSMIKQKLNSKDFSAETIWDKKIVFDDYNYIDLALEKEKNTTINFSWTNSGSLEISIKNWWPIFYEFLSFSWSNNSIKEITSSWIINNNKSFTWWLSEKYDKWKLEIKNLWWFTNFSLRSSINLWLKYKNYKIIQKIWNKKVIEKKWKIKIN